MFKTFFDLPLIFPYTWNKWSLMKVTFWALGFQSKTERIPAFTVVKWITNYYLHVFQQGKQAVNVCTNYSNHFYLININCVLIFQFPFTLFYFIIRCTLNLIILILAFIHTNCPIFCCVHSVLLNLKSLIKYVL